MEDFQNQFNSVSEQLMLNLQKFYNKNNNSAGTRARKHSQELKVLLQNLRNNILNLQKERKSSKSSDK